MNWKKWVRPAAAVFGGLTALGTGLVSLYMLWERPPEAAPAPEAAANVAPAQPKSAAPTPSATPDRGTAFDTKRHDGVYTLLLAGSDDGTGNTDTILLGRLDTVQHTANFVSLPRDTLINVDTPIRKLNSVYWGAVNAGSVGSEALRRHVKKLCGFDVDCYAVVSLEAFEQAVDALGGVWFEVPQRMYYDQGPVIDLEPGWQLLNGEQCMWLCRYRSGYVNGDLDRIAVQHDFLKAAAEQFLQLGSIPNIPQAAALIAESTDTNMTAANIAWFARQLLRCSADDIRFFTAPNTPAYVRDISYTFLDLYDWLELVNTRLNPGAAPITEGQLDLVYLHNGEVCCTAALQGLSYFELGRRPSAPAETETPASLQPPENFPLPPRATPRRYEEAPAPEEWLAPPAPEAEPEPTPAPTPAPVSPPVLSPLDDDWMS